MELQQVKRSSTVTGFPYQRLSGNILYEFQILGQRVVRDRSKQVNLLPDANLSCLVTRS